MVKFELDVDLLLVVYVWLSWVLPDVLVEAVVAESLNIVVHDHVLEGVGEILRV